jgi:hypothetical protein
VQLDIKREEKIAVRKCNISFDDAPCFNLHYLVQRNFLGNLSIQYSRRDVAHHWKQTAKKRYVTLILFKPNNSIKFTIFYMFALESISNPLSFKYLSLFSIGFDLSLPSS